MQSSTITWGTGNCRSKGFRRSIIQCNTLHNTPYGEKIMGIEKLKEGINAACIINKKWTPPVKGWWVGWKLEWVEMGSWRVGTDGAVKTLQSIPRERQRQAKNHNGTWECWVCHQISHAWFFFETTNFPCIISSTALGEACEGLKRWIRVGMEIVCSMLVGEVVSILQCEWHYLLLLTAISGSHGGLPADRALFSCSDLSNINRMWSINKICLISNLHLHCIGKSCVG
jgi:hypothetical protein